MKLNSQTGHLAKVPLAPKQAKLAKSGQKAPAQSTLGDHLDLDPLQSSFRLLAQHDRRAATYEVERIKTNLKNGYEALVQFKAQDDSTFVLPVRKESDVPLYTALVTGAEVEPSLENLHKDLKKASQENNKFYILRDDQYLRTDAAAASLSLQRGSRLVVQRNDGQYQTHRSPESAREFLSQSNPQARQNRSHLESAKAAGLKLSPLPSDDPKDKGTLAALRRMFDDSSELEIDKTLTEALQSDGRLQVAFENDERPLALPLTLNKAEIDLAAKWSQSPPENVAQFQKDFQKLSRDKTIFMTQQSQGDMKGMVVKADDRATYFQLLQGERVVVLDKNGDLHEMKSLAEFERFQKTGRVTAPLAEPFDGSKTDSDNLMMFYHVSPFDPLAKGNYDDLPQRISSVGSSQQLDIVTMRSDLPNKRNLRVERVQSGELQELKKLDPETAMNNPKVLEDFVYETVKSNLGDDKIRFLVGGHGGAEKGLLPDGEHNNSAANEAMPVDKFAGAISQALTRIENETGERPRIDNLMLVSCLMGNTSFIHALAETGDIDTLVASPELMAGSNPISTFEYLNDPKTSKASGREYAEYLVEEWSQAPAMIGGDKEQHHADTIGAYDLSPAKAKRFQKALGGFFEAALAEPQYAEYLKESIAKAPSYGINPVVNIMFDVDNRDLLQVLDHTSQDARITSPKLKKAIAELMEATEAQVIQQKVSEKYEGRRGPSLYLPLDKWDFDEKMTQTKLLKSVKYKEFMDMIFDAPLQRSPGQNLINEVSRLAQEGVFEEAIKKVTEAPQSEQTEASQETAKSDDAGASSDQGPKLDADMKAFADLITKTIEASNSPEAKELQSLHTLEKPLAPQHSKKVLGFLKNSVKTALGVAVGAVAGAVLAAPAAALGAVTGTLAGWRGVSASGTSKPTGKEETQALTSVVDELLHNNGLGASEKASDASPSPADLKSDAPSAPDSDSEDKTGLDVSTLVKLSKGGVGKGIKQLLLWPCEGLAIKTHEAAGRRLGEYPGRVIGALTGAATGALLSALAVGGVAFVGAGYFTASQVDNAVSRLQPGEPQKGSDFFTGRFLPPEQSS